MPAFLAYCAKVLSMNEASTGASLKPYIWLTASDAIYRRNVTQFNLLSKSRHMLFKQNHVAQKKIAFCSRCVIVSFFSFLFRPVEKLPFGSCSRELLEAAAAKLEQLDAIKELKVVILS